MSRRLLFATLILSSFIVFAQVPSDEQEPVSKPGCGEKTAVEKSENLQTDCPVMGGEINKEIFVDHEGKRIYFCCQSCVDTFKKDPAAYMKKLEASGVNLEGVPGCEKKHCGEKEKSSSCCEKGKCQGCNKHQEVPKE
jgi:YHS domain-containing protein